MTDNTDFVDAQTLVKYKQIELNRAKNKTRNGIITLLIGVIGAFILWSFLAGPDRHSGGLYALGVLVFGLGCAFIFWKRVSDPDAYVKPAIVEAEQSLEQAIEMAKQDKSGNKTHKAENPSTDMLIVVPVVLVVCVGLYLLAKGIFSDGGHRPKEVKPVKTGMIQTPRKPVQSPPAPLADIPKSKVPTFDFVPPDLTPKTPTPKTLPKKTPTPKTPTKKTSFSFIPPDLSTNYTPYYPEPKANQEQKIK